MRVAFDPAKRIEVLQTRGVDLLRAALILIGPHLSYEDTRHDYGETRIIATGEVEGEFYTIVYTQDGDAFRIVTAWRAGRRARRGFEEFLVR